MRRWFILSAYSGFENKVKENVERRIHTLNMEDKVFQVLAPDKEEISIDKNGKEKHKLSKLFPSYVFVEVEVDETGNMDDGTWFNLRNTPNVAGILGSSGNGTKPVPVPVEEMNQVLETIGMKEKPTFDFRVGEKVVVLNGLYRDQIAEISAINMEKQIVTVLVEMFGRATPTELNFNEIKKIGA